MANIITQLSELFSLKWVRKHSPASSTASANAESSLQNSPFQGYGPKVMKSVRSNRSSPGHLDDQTEIDMSYKEGFQYHPTSKMIRDTLESGLEETRENFKPRLQRMQYPALPCPANLQLLEPPPPPPPTPNKPLPDIPTQVRPYTATDGVSQRSRDCRVSTWSTPHTRRQTRANYSVFPEHVSVPPRTTSLEFSRPHQKTHKYHQSPKRTITTTKHLHRHIAELYHDPSKGNEKTIGLRDGHVQEPLPRAVGSPPIQESDIGPRGRDFICPQDGVISDLVVEVAHSFPGSPRGLAIDSPQVEYNCDKETPTISQPCSPKTLRPESSSARPTKTTSPLYPNLRAAPGAYSKADDDYNSRLSMGSQENRSNRTTRGRRPIGVSPELSTTANSLKSRRREITEARPKFTPYERTVSIVLATSKSATHLPMDEFEAYPVFTKKSVPNLRRAAVYEPLQFHQLPQLPRPPEPAQPPWVDAPMRSAFDSDDEEKYSRFDFLRIYRRRSSDTWRSGKNNPLKFKWRRSKND